MTKLTRQEHIAWCKERAILEINYSKRPIDGIVSMMSDLRKHPETNNEALLALCGSMIISRPTMSRQDAINFINGFN